MKPILTTLALCALTATSAFAGGPVIEETYEAEPAPKLSPGEKLAIAAGLILVIGLIASGGGSDCTCNTPEDGGNGCGCP